MHAIKYPASLTKIMTGLLALENLELDRVVTIDAETPFTKGSRIYLLEGEQVTVEQLFYALMIESANDAAVALAKEISGTVEDFAALMNRRAKELGALNTNFVNPNGLENDGHVTTAYDLAMISTARRTAR
jgi:D-alanyl-D-alanine carboxypeptidase (penicillin-binding protein 5/6)